MRKLSLLLVILINCSTFGQNKLDKSKNELNSGSSKKNQSSSSYSSSSGSSKSKSSGLPKESSFRIFARLSYFNSVIEEFSSLKHLSR